MKIVVGLGIGDWVESHACRPLCGDELLLRAASHELGGIRGTVDVISVVDNLGLHSSVISWLKRHHWWRGKSVSVVL